MLDHRTFDADRWLEALGRRRSRREFDGSPVPAEDLAALEALGGEQGAWDDARCVLVRDAPERLYSGILGSYGRVNGAPCALLFIARSDSPTAQEHCGYEGERIVLEATARGLDTCWIGGFFSGHVAERLVRLRDGESVLAVSPLGHAVAEPPARERTIFGAGKPKHRKPLERIAPGSPAWPEWARAGVEAAQVAPSAVNRQPWLFSLADGAVTITAVGASTPKVATRLDCGIAMLHFEVGARASGAVGSWESLGSPAVARWTRAPEPA